MHRFDERTAEVARLCFDYALWRLQLDPVPLDRPRSPAELVAAAGRSITPEGRDPAEVLRTFGEVLAPACISNDSWRYLAFIPEAPTKAAQLFDVVVSASAISGTSWLEASGAVHAENEALRWLADLAAFPPEAGGCFVSGGSAANLAALAVAREVVAERTGRDGPWRVAVAAGVHSSVHSALRILGMTPLVVPCGEVMGGDDLARTLSADPEAASVCAVVATAGTTNTGAVDDLAGVAEVAARHGLWTHVDGAYGLGALCVPEERHRFAGIEGADSFCVDPHKWLFAPFDCAALLYRSPELARRVHAQHAAYLDPIHTGGDWNPSDYAYHLTRRARGLPFWFSLAVHGTDAYAAAVRATLRTARLAAARIREAPHTELVCDPTLTVVLWRRRGWDADDYASWSRRLLDDQVAFLLPTRWRDETVARAVFLHPDCPDTFVDELLDTMR